MNLKRNDLVLVSYMDANFNLARTTTVGYVYSLTHEELILYSHYNHESQDGKGFTMILIKNLVKVVKLIEDKNGLLMLKANC